MDGSGLIRKRIDRALESPGPQAWGPEQVRWPPGPCAATSRPPTGLQWRRADHRAVVRDEAAAAGSRPAGRPRRAVVPRADGDADTHPRRADRHERATRRVPAAPRGPVAGGGGRTQHAAPRDAGTASARGVRRHGPRGTRCRDAVTGGQAAGGLAGGRGVRAVGRAPALRPHSAVPPPHLRAPGRHERARGGLADRHARAASPRPPGRAASSSTSARRATRRRACPPVSATGP